MEKYLIDSNIISGFFSEKYSEKSMHLISEIIGKVPVIPVITKIEAFSWVNSDKGKEMIVREFINDSKILNLSEDIISYCIKLRRSRKIKTPDAIIAATAIVNGMTLISNDSEFSKIKELKVFSPN
ncbi:MAG: type II toxin-antitoxin system VapC family toxin [Bacteroidetes bacterium]|nr:type II toxin-antitoxin system VapC family toxin [Bacteroidota bacterium]